jgi:hypothetical protein
VPEKPMFGEFSLSEIIVDLPSKKIRVSRNRPSAILLPLLH